MAHYSDRQLIEFFSQFVIDERLNLFQRTLTNRTRYLTVVLEDIFQTQNASAVLRTCELFGVQDISCPLYTSPSPRDQRGSRMPSSARKQ